MFGNNCSQSSQYVVHQLSSHVLPASSGFHGTIVVCARYIVTGHTIYQVYITHSIYNKIYITYNICV